MEVILPEERGLNIDDEKQATQPEIKQQTVKKDPLPECLWGNR
jgi:hypothetical protein